MVAIFYENAILCNELVPALARISGLVGEIHKILVPLDFASDYKAIIPWVQDFAQEFNATLYLLYVPYFPTFYVNINLDTYQAEVQVAAREQMSNTVGNFFKDFSKLETRVEFGPPAAKILEVAEKEKMDMVIMGTGSRNGRERAFFGSVALKVVQSALCPVVTILL
jgi:nucleotide-binding universal stress UspA family protein